MKGVDVSTWQHPGQAEVDWHEVADDGYSFVLVKATQGTSYVNPWLARDLDDARAAGLLVGAYHFYEAGQPVDAQGELFTNSLVGQVLELGTWLDFEPGTMPGYTASSDCSGFITKVNEVRHSCGLYVDLSWHEALKAVNFAFPRLWLAAPSLTETPEGCLVWQRAAGPVKGIQGDVDIDVLTSARGLNIPTAPKPKPTAATTTPVRPPAEPDADDDDDGTAVDSAPEEPAL